MRDEGGVGEWMDVDFKEIQVHINALPFNCAIWPWDLEVISLASASLSEYSSRYLWRWIAICLALHLAHHWCLVKLNSFLPALLEPQKSIQVSEKHGMFYDSCFFSPKDPALLILAFHFIAMQNAVPTDVPLLGQPTMMPLTPLSQGKQTRFEGDRLSCKLGKQWSALFFNVTERAMRMNAVTLCFSLIVSWAF